MFGSVPVKSIHRAFAMLASVVMLCSVVALVGCSSAEPSQAPETGVSVSVNIDATRGGGSDTTTTVNITDGASAYDALVATGLVIEGEPSYVTSIDGLAEGAHGKKSGWLYSVNDEIPSDACNRYVLHGGEKVTWSYSLDYGNDL